MSISLTLLQQTLVMALIMGVGFVLSRKGAIRDETALDLGKILTRIVIPLVIIQSFWTDFSFDRLSNLIISLALSTISLAISIVISHRIFHRNGVAEFASEFSNAGFIGIPLLSSTLGVDAVFNITCLIAMLNIMQWTYGRYQISRSKDIISMRSIASSPMLISFFIGMLLFLLRVPQPKIIGTFLGDISYLNTPIAMIILGTYLAKTTLRALFLQPRLYLIGMCRLILAPIATLAVFLLLPVDHTVRMSLLIASAAPAGSNVAIFSHQLGKNRELACNAVCLTTLLSIVTMPSIVALASMLMR